MPHKKRASPVQESLANTLAAGTSAANASLQPSTPPHPSAAAGTTPAGAAATGVAPTFPDQSASAAPAQHPSMPTAEAAPALRRSVKATAGGYDSSSSSDSLTARGAQAVGAGSPRVGGGPAAAEVAAPVEERAAQVATATKQSVAQAAESAGRSAAQAADATRQAAARTSESTQQAAAQASQAAASTVEAAKHVTAETAAAASERAHHPAEAGRGVVRAAVERVRVTAERWLGVSCSELFSKHVLCADNLSRHALHPRHT